MGFLSGLINRKANRKANRAKRKIARIERRRIGVIQSLTDMRQRLQRTNLEDSFQRPGAGFVLNDSMQAFLRKEMTKQHQSEQLALDKARLTGEVNEQLAKAEGKALKFEGLDNLISFIGQATAGASASGNVQVGAVPVGVGGLQAEFAAGRDPSVSRFAQRGLGTGMTPQEQRAITGGLTSPAGFRPDITGTGFGATPQRQQFFGGGTQPTDRPADVSPGNRQRVLRSIGLFI